MRIVTARELKNRTGDIIRRARAGERFIVTVRGRPAAAITSVQALGTSAMQPRPRAEAWADIERALAAGAPRFDTWQEAMAWVRKRG